MTDPVNFEMHDKNFRGCWFTGDNDEIVDKLATAHRFFVTDYFDLTRENEELQHYKESISAICAIKNIPFISLDWDDLGTCNWMSEGRHPNKEEHLEIANLIYKNFYHDIIT
jgi:hypothetical protein